MERVVDTIARGLAARGHDVVLYASADSTCPVRLEPTIEHALWPEDLRLGRRGDEGADERAVRRTVERVVADADRFDIIHVHLDGPGLEGLRSIAERVVATVHLPLDDADRRQRYESLGLAGLVALSSSQTKDAPDLPWLRVIPNGLDLPDKDRTLADEESESVPLDRDALCFVGRLDPAKGPLEAIEIARLSGRRLRVAAKAGGLPSQRDFVRDRFLPALRTADVEYLGELDSAARDRLIAGSLATLMPVTWPEPFGLVAIESLVLGTPVLAHPLGALPEIVRHGHDGYLAPTEEELAALVDDVSGLDRNQIGASARRRFGAGRMVAAYEEVLRRAARGPAGEGGSRRFRRVVLSWVGGRRTPSGASGLARASFRGARR